MEISIFLFFEELSNCCAMCCLHSKWTLLSEGFSLYSGFSVVSSIPTFSNICFGIELVRSFFFRPGRFGFAKISLSSSLGLSPFFVEKLASLALFVEGRGGVNPITLSILFLPKTQKKVQGKETGTRFISRKLSFFFFVFLVCLWWRGEFWLPMHWLISKGGCNFVCPPLKTSYSSNSFSIPYLSAP